MFDTQHTTAHTRDNPHWTLCKVRAAHTALCGDGEWQPGTDCGSADISPLLLATSRHPPAHSRTPLNNAPGKIFEYFHRNI